MYGWALVLVPALLLLSAAGAVWFHWRTETDDAPHPGLALGAAALGDGELRDAVRKLTEYIGPREWETPEGRTHLRQVIAYVSGTLSPRNYGYVVRSDGELSLAGERWPALWVDARGAEGGLVMVAVPYDGDAASVVVALALAGELREAGLKRTVRFVFYPAELWGRAGPTEARVPGNGGGGAVCPPARTGAGPLVGGARARRGGRAFSRGGGRARCRIRRRPGGRPLCPVERPGLRDPGHQCAGSAGSGDGGRRRPDGGRPDQSGRFAGPGGSIGGDFAGRGQFGVKNALMPGGGGSMSRAPRGMGH